jgi:hypothetical protein
MATSGSVDFSVNRDNILEDSLRTVGAIGPEDSASTEQKNHAARLLNMLVKNWHGFGIGLWARKTGWILPQTDTNEIDLGPSGDHATLSYVQTALSADASSGATTISVDSATGIANTYNIGIEQSDGTMQWTTVSGAPSGTTITLAAALTGDASDGGYVWVYQTKIQRPLRIVEAYSRDEVANTEVEMDVVAKQEYEAMSNKEAEGEPILLAYDPQLTDGRVFIYPRFSDGKTAIKIVFHRPFEDFDAANDTPDFPQAWYLPLMLQLAVLLAPVYGLPVSDRKELKTEAGAALSLALANDTEEGSLKIQPDNEGS